MPKRCVELTGQFFRLRTFIPGMMSSFLPTLVRSIDGPCHAVSLEPCSVVQQTAKPSSDTVGTSFPGVCADAVSPASGGKHLLMTHRRKFFWPMLSPSLDPRCPLGCCPPPLGPGAPPRQRAPKKTCLA